MPTSYANYGGTGARSTVIVVSTTHSINGSPTVLLDGLINNAFFFGNASVAGSVVLFQFAQSVLIDEAKWYQDNGTSHGTWQWQGSNDLVIWTNIGSTFTLGGASPSQTQTTLNGNATSYSNYRMLGVSGSSSSSPWLQEIEFKISGFVVAAPVGPKFAKAGAMTHQTVRQPSAFGSSTTGGNSGFVA